MKRILIILLILTPWLFASAQSMRVHFVNVGQGAATLFEFPCGCALVDTGGEKNGSFDSTAELLGYLDKFFEERPDLHKTIDVMYLTHPHIDHTRGAPDVWNRFQIRNVVTNGSKKPSSGSAQQNTIQAHVRDAKVTDDMHDDVGFEGVHVDQIPANTGLTNATIDPVNCTDIDPRFFVLWGTVDDKPAKWTQTQFKDQNNHSVVVRVEYGASSVLVPGDIEEAAITGLVDRYKQGHLLDVDVIQVAHHGSKNGTTEALLKAETPLLAVIAAGDPAREESWTAWDYGHPNGGIVNLLQKGVMLDRKPADVLVGDGKRNFGTVTVSKAVYCTGWDGGTILETRGDGHWEVVTASATAPAGLVDINKATAAELIGLPAIGKARAQAIIKYRSENGPIRSADDLSKVPGFGPATLEALRGKIAFE